jgi:hypothetical protein
VAASAAGLTKVQIVDVDGDTLVAVRRSNLTAEQKRALAIYDNRTAELAEWNWEQLAEDKAGGLTLAPFWTTAELAEGLAGASSHSGHDPADVPPPRATDIVRGDLFELGGHRLLCGDATDAADVLRVLEGARAAVCLTDPPYGLGVGYVGFDDTREAVTALARAWLPLARQHADVVVFSPGVTGQWLYPEPDWVLCWFYGGGPLRSPWGFSCWQPFLAYGPDPSLAHGHGGRPDACDSNVPANADALGHPCPKPIPIWVWLMQRLTFEADALVLDPFVGSGTGLIAAEQEGRRCRAIELAPPYVQVAIDRWEAYTGRRAVKVGEAIR